MYSSKRERFADDSTSSTGASTSSTGASTSATGASTSDERSIAVAEAPSPPGAVTDLERVHRELGAAAVAADQAGLALDDFMRLAWSSFVDARPGLRDHLADTQLMQQIQELRSQGRVGLA